MSTSREDSTAASEPEPDASSAEALPGARSPRDPAPVSVGGMGPTGFGEKTWCQVAQLLVESPRRWAVLVGIGD